MQNQIEAPEVRLTQEVVWYHLDELKHLASVAGFLDGERDDNPGGDGPSYGLNWAEYGENPEKEPEKWLSTKLFPFLKVLARRLDDAHKVFSQLESMAGNVDLYDGAVKDDPDEGGEVSCTDEPRGWHNLIAEHPKEFVMFMELVVDGGDGLRMFMEEVSRQHELMQNRLAAN